MRKPVRRPQRLQPSRRGKAARPAGQAAPVRLAGRDDLLDELLGCYDLDCSVLAPLPEMQCPPSPPPSTVLLHFDDEYSDAEEAARWEVLKKKLRAAAPDAHFDDARATRSPDASAAPRQLEHDRHLWKQHWKQVWQQRRRRNEKQDPSQLEVQRARHQAWQVEWMTLQVEWVGRTTGACRAFHGLAALFVFPVRDAAAKFGMCKTTFKRFCHARGVYKWPFRRLASARTSMWHVEALAGCLHDAPECWEDIVELHRLFTDLERLTWAAPLAPTPAPHGALKQQLFRAAAMMRDTTTLEQAQMVARMALGRMLASAKAHAKQQQAAAQTVRAAQAGAAKS